MAYVYYLYGCLVLLVVPRYTSGSLNVARYSAAPVQYHIQTDTGPARYFRYETTNGQWRKEKRLRNGRVVGAYGWTDGRGVLRLYDYLADQDGYRIVRQRNFNVGSVDDLLAFYNHIQIYDNGGVGARNHFVSSDNKVRSAGGSSVYGDNRQYGGRRVSPTEDQKLFRKADRKLSTDDNRRKNYQKVRNYGKANALATAQDRIHEESVEDFQAGNEIVSLKMKENKNGLVKENDTRGKRRSNFDKISDAGERRRIARGKKLFPCLVGNDLLKCKHRKNFHADEGKGHLISNSEFNERNHINDNDSVYPGTGESISGTSMSTNGDTSSGTSNTDEEMIPLKDPHTGGISYHYSSTLDTRDDGAITSDDRGSGTRNQYSSILATVAGDDVTNSDEKDFPVSISRDDDGHFDPVYEVGFGEGSNIALLERSAKAESPPGALDLRFLSTRRAADSQIRVPMSRQLRARFVTGLRTQNEALKFPGASESKALAAVRYGDHTDERNQPPAVYRGQPAAVHRAEPAAVNMYSGRPTSENSRRT